jgi:hypothetical protein
MWGSGDEKLYFVKIGLSWLAVLAGLMLSVLGFGMLGVEPLASPFYPPSPHTWLESLTLLFLGATGAAASFIAFRNRKIASLLYWIAGPVVALGVWFCKMNLAEVIFGPRGPRNQYPASASVAIAFVPLILLAYFWSIAHRYQWPHMTAGKRLPVWARLVLAAVASLLFCGCICATSVRAAQMWQDECDYGVPWPFSKSYPGHAVLVARVVHVDSITGAMAVVQQRFAGLPWWNKIVFLKSIPEKGTWFVHGGVEGGIVTRWLVPVLDQKCSGSAPIQDAGVELRLFRDSPHWEGVRIIGRVHDPSRGWTPAPGATVVVEGLNGSITTVTDHDGIYDISGLAPGHYSIRVPASRHRATCQDSTEQGLKSGDVWGCELVLW